jgi:hypothetical protein
LGYREGLGKRAMKTKAAGGVLAIILLAGSASAEDYFKAPNGHWCTGNRQHIGCMLSTETVSGITASVAFDENGRSVDTGTVYDMEFFDPLTKQSMPMKKEPAVEWCENFGTLQQVYNEKWELIEQYHLYELCGMSDHSVIWRRKAK